MDGVRGNAADLFFECPICKDDGYIGQLGGRSLVNASCPAAHVFHLECITRWLESEQQLAKSLDQRECICKQPVLPLIRLKDMRPLEDESPYCETRIFNACRTGNLRDMRMLLRQDETLANRTYHSVKTGHPEHLLAVAIKEEHSDLLRLLIDYGADVNAAEHGGKPPLHIAARLRRTEDFNMLIRAGADINNALRTAVQDGDAPLLEYLISTQPGQLAINNALREAAERGQTQCLNLLIDAGADDLNGALYIAVQSENIEVRDVLELHGAKIITVLHTAARDGSLEFFNLLHNPILINKTDEEGQTSLHITAASGHSRCLEKLLEIRGVDVNAADKNGETALHLAVYNGHVGCLKKLIEKGVNLNAINKNGETVLHIATKISTSEGRQRLTAKSDINAPKFTWRTNGWFTSTTTECLIPKHYTIKKENGIGCLKELIDTRGVNINVTDNNGVTPLMIAAFWGKLEHLSLLLEAGAYVNATAWMFNDTTQKLGWMALHFAAFNGSAEAVKALLNIPGINVNKKDGLNRTALHYAAQSGSAEAVKALLDFPGIRTYGYDKYGRSVLHCAAAAGCAESIKMLVHRIRDSNQDCRGFLALHYAAQSGSAEAVKALLPWTDVNRKTYGVWESCRVVNEYFGFFDQRARHAFTREHFCYLSWTPLHFAALSGSAESVKALLAAPDIKTNEQVFGGGTALSVATKYGHTACEKLLAENGAINNRWSCLLQ